MIQDRDKENKLANWRCRGKQQLVRVVGGSGGEGQGEVFIQYWERKARWQRAFKVLGVSWVLACAALFIPVAHFVLVPSLALAGPILLMFKLRQKSVVLGGVAQCPECQQSFFIARNAHRWPMEEACSHCRRTLVLHPLDVIPQD